MAIIWLCFFLLISFGCSCSCAFSLLTFPSLSISLSIVCSFRWAVSLHVALSSALKTSPFLLMLFPFVFSYSSASFAPIQEVGSFSNHHCIHIHCIRIPSQCSVHYFFPLSVLLGAQVVAPVGSEAGKYEVLSLHFFSCGGLPLVDPYWQGVFLEYAGVYPFLQALLKHFNASMCGSIPPCSGQ